MCDNYADKPMDRAEFEQLEKEAFQLKMLELHKLFLEDHGLWEEFEDFADAHCDNVRFEHP